MDIINAIIFGIVQGVTEFVPISSSGHLVILHEVIASPINKELLFDVMLHLATLLAVILFFRKEIITLLNSWLRSFKGQPDQYSRLSWLIILGTIPAGLAGWWFEGLIVNVFRAPIVVIIMLIIVGILLIISERLSKQQENIYNLNWQKVLVIGLAQALALIPGTSRSGITIIAGLGVGLKRQAAVKFSFLLSVPIILGATIKKTPSLLTANLSIDQWLIVGVAFFVAFVTGFFAIKYFLQFVSRFKLYSLAYYRFGLALVLIIYFFVLR